MNGIKVFEGISIGKALVYEEINIKDLIKETIIEDSEILLEIKRLDEIIKKTKNELDILKLHALETVGKEEAEIFDAHLMILDDPMLLDAIKENVKNSKYNLEWSIFQAREKIVEQFRKIEDEYIRARAQDIVDVTDRLLRICLQIEITQLNLIYKDTVIVAKDLKPSETVVLNDNVVGIILESGSITSHAAIVAKAKGIPTLVGVKNACSIIENDETIIMDTTQSKFIVNPDSELIRIYKCKIKEQQKEVERLKKLINIDAQTKDGYKVKLYGNAGTLEEVRLVKEQGAKGIGLLRTELIYMENDHFPTEDEQFNYYKKIVGLMEDETIIRTLDIGGDKHLSYYNFPIETNPFLGERAIRFCLHNQDIFLTQLRAILRASYYGKVKVMFPMISSLEEIKQAKELLEKAKIQLEEKDIPFDKNIQVGMMIEIPAAAISAHIFAKEVDFFSIGTNDLCQYTYAVDRMNPKVAHLCQPLHPSILRLILTTIDAANNNNIEVGVCGEMAGDKDLAALLVGMGIKKLSMSPSMINRVKEKIRSKTLKELQNVAFEVLKTTNSDDAIKILKGDELC